MPPVEEEEPPPPVRVIIWMYDSAVHHFGIRWTVSGHMSHCVMQKSCRAHGCWDWEGGYDFFRLIFTVLV